jgi:Uncharacterized protein conserved in bacteria
VSGLKRGVILGLLAMFAALPARAQTPEEFYKGRTMRMLIPAAVGDSYDTEGRLIARFLSNFIPGHPTIVAENMPGASGRNVASYMYNVAPKDGSVIALVQQSIRWPGRRAKAVSISTRRNSTGSARRRRRSACSRSGTPPASRPSKKPGRRK